MPEPIVEEAAKPESAAAAPETAKPAAEAAKPETAKAAEPVKAAEPAKGPVSTVKQTSIISDAGKAAAPADKGAAETPEAKAAAEALAKTEAENKRLLEADDKTLSPEDLAKKQELLKAQADAKAKGVPEKYEIKAPEGMTIDETIMKEFTPIAKELGLSNEGVQKLVDFEAKRLSAAQTASEAAQKQSFETFRETTRNEAVEFFGSKLADELPYVAKGRDNFADDEVMQLLEATGLSNHKAFIKMFAKMGRTVSEDKLADGKASGAEDTRTPGQIIYAKDK